MTHVASRVIIIYGKFYFSALFAKALDGVNVKDLITNIGSAVGSAPAGAPAAGGAAPAEEKKGIINILLYKTILNLKIKIATY